MTKCRKTIEFVEIPSWSPSFLVGFLMLSVDKKRCVTRPMQMINNVNRVMSKPYMFDIPLKTVLFSCCTIDTSFLSLYFLKPLQKAPRTGVVKQVIITIILLLSTDSLWIWLSAASPPENVRKGPFRTREYPSTAC